MKNEYDFSKGERGKFFREGAVLVPPIQPADLESPPESGLQTGTSAFAALFRRFTNWSNYGDSALNWRRINGGLQCWCQSEDGLLVHCHRNSQRHVA